MTDTVKYILDEERLPKSWYNIVADLPQPPPDMISPATREPISAGDLEPLFSRSIIEQELSTERWIDIPAPVRDIYRQWRPTPLFRARRLESALQTPAKIYYKYEGCSPSGSHKTNTAIPQAFLAKSDGVKKLTTETGAGQWGSAISLAGSLMSLEIEVFMVKVSYEQKPYRRAFMQSFGGNCIVSPSDLTQAGRDILAKNPGSTGSLGTERVNDNETA
jgi:tryptophan synthase beta chain